MNVLPDIALRVRELLCAGVIAAVALLGAVARADLPGTIPLAASGDGHIWWVVKSEQPGTKSQGVATTAGAVTFALMHHASDEPAPSERLVMRFPLEPVALEASELNKALCPQRARGRCGLRAEDVGEPGPVARALQQFNLRLQ